jgi:nucleotide-binding universal stress UspA family protein
VSYATILVNLEAGQSNADVLAAAKQLADRFHAGVIGCSACTSVMMINNDGSAYGDMLEQDSKEIKVELAAAETEFRDAMGGALSFVDWRGQGPVLSISGHVVHEASRADLILTGVAKSENTSRYVNTGDLIMHAGRPVLLVPSLPGPLGMGRIMVGWTNTREARRAVADALPLLKQADEVSVIEFASADEMDSARARLADVSSWLVRHGIVAETQVRQAGRSTAASLEALATERNADLVVTGAYGHSRAREWAFGGVTRTLLTPTTRFSFLSH